jgi:N-acetylgalactosamine PTS system EIIC component
MMNVWLFFWIAIYAFFAAIDQFSGFEILDQPLIVGVIVGSILGNVSNGFLIGVVIQLITLGHFPVGGSQPPNRLLHTLVATILGILIFPLTPLVGVLIALPFGFLGQKMNMLIFRHNNRYLLQATQRIENGRLDNIELLQVKSAMVMGMSFALMALLSFLGIIWISSTIYELIQPVSKVLIQSTYALVGFGLAQLFLQLNQKGAWSRLLMGLIFIGVLSQFLNLTLAVLIVLGFGGFLEIRKTKTSESIDEGGI